MSELAYHPDWQSNLDEVFDFGLVGWNHDAELLARYGRAPMTLLTAFDYLVGQADIAPLLPGRTGARDRRRPRALRRPDLRARLLPGVVSTLAATRLQTAQVEAFRKGDKWLLRGEKWFTSNVGAEVIVTLARVDPAKLGTRGLAMFIVPRRRADGSRNAISIRRLKDKMGTIGVRAAR